jgi:hypothetical protein
MNKLNFMWGMPAVLSCISLLLAEPARSQAPAKQCWQFHSLNQFGLLQGESTNVLQLQTVNGWEKKNFFAGIGVALDYYQYKSIPLFLDLRQSFGSEKNRVFLYGDAGPHFVWVHQPRQYNYTTTYATGFYSDAGLGYRRNFKTGMALPHIAAF